MSVEKLRAHYGANAKKPVFTHAYLEQVFKRLKQLGLLDEDDIANAGGDVVYCTIDNIRICCADYEMDEDDLAEDLREGGDGKRSIDDVGPNVVDIQFGPSHAFTVALQIPSEEFIDGFEMEHVEKLRAHTRALYAKKRALDKQIKKLKQDTLKAISDAIAEDLKIK